MKNQKITIPENTRVIIEDGVIIFERKEPLLADLIKEEKKPLYVNSFGTEFFDGDDYYYVTKSDYTINKRVNFGVNFLCPEEDFRYTEIMTKKQCYQWLADNCNE